MLAANVWHWWIGAALALLGGGAVLGLVAAYIKTVVSPQHPSRRQRQMLESQERESLHSK